MSFDFSGKTVLITGASYGLGEQFAYAFADAGADLVLTARSADLLAAVADTCRGKGSTVTVETGDVSVEDDVKRVVAAGVAAHGTIDALINNAGIADMRGLAAERFDAETKADEVVKAIDRDGAAIVERLFSEERVDRVKRKGRSNEDVGFPGERGQRAVTRGGFERADGGGANCDNTTASGAGFGECS